MIKYSIEVSTLVTPLEVPYDVKSLLSSQELTAFADGGRFFKSAAAKLQDPLLRDLLDDLNDDSRPLLTLEKEGNGPWISWFQFSFAFRKTSPGLRVTSGHLIPAYFPVRIKSFYELFGGLRNTTTCRSGMLPPEYWVSSNDLGDGTVASHPQSTADAVFFFSFGNGDYMGCSENGEELFYSHEGAVYESTEIDFVLDAFYKDLLASRFD